jgi:hypothetical protein
MKFQYTTQKHYDRSIKYRNKTGASKEIIIKWWILIINDTL